MLHTKQSCPQDGQMRDPWKRDPDMEPLISKINCENMKGCITSMSLLSVVCNALQYKIFTLLLPLLPRSHTETIVPTPESSPP